MKTSLALALVLLLAVPALSQSTIGITFDDTMLINNLIFGTGPFTSYIYVQTAESSLIAAYECAIVSDGGTLFLLNAAGPNGWTNFGAPSNQLVGFQTPLPVGPDGWVVVCTLDWLLAESGSWIVIDLGPASPSSFDPPTPGFADGLNPDILIPCAAERDTSTTSSPSRT
ncbi:MAG: hypothetical protein R3D98_13535 [Candidatus Krumholzibacteriia bacterium]